MSIFITTRKMTQYEQGRKDIIVELQKRADYLCMWMREQNEPEDVTIAYITGVQDMIPEFFDDIAYKPKEETKQRQRLKGGGK